MFTLPGVIKVNENINFPDVQLDVKVAYPQSLLPIV